MLTGILQIKALPAWNWCRSCGGPNAPAAEFCDACWSWATHGRPLSPPAPNRYELERMIARLARRVAALESDTDFGGWGWQREFYEWSERVALLEAHR
jgi:hypothetical protein